MSGIKQSQLLKLQQKISPQQIQFIKLLQIPTVSLDQRIKEEVEINPALEDEPDEGYHYGNETREQPDNGQEQNENEQDAGSTENYESAEREMSLDEYLTESTYDYKTKLPSSPDDDDDYEIPIVQTQSLYDSLFDQFSLLKISAEERLVGEHIIGNIDEDGYLRRPLKQIVSDLAFRQGISVGLETAQNALRHIQGLDPAGIAAQDLQECLLIQLKRKQKCPEVDIAVKIIQQHFEDLTKKHFHKIKSRLGLKDEQLRDAYEVITKLNPKPGESQSMAKNEYIVPDFILTVENEEVIVKLNVKNAPELKVSKNYVNMYRNLKANEKASKDEKVKETLEFLKNKIDAAQWFIDALKQRQYTLLYTMQSIAAHQREYFLSGGDDRKLKPMILKDIATEIDMDISTVSRVANSKYVQTDFGIFPLKRFFSEGIETTDGIVSNREIKSVLKEMIEHEDRQDPLSDDLLTETLNQKGYNIARRTVAKYREQLNIPVARLRKEV